VYNPEKSTIERYLQILKRTLHGRDKISKKKQYTGKIAD